LKFEKYFIESSSSSFQQSTNLFAQTVLVASILQSFGLVNTILKVDMSTKNLTLNQKVAMTKQLLSCMAVTSVYGSGNQCNADGKEANCLTKSLKLADDFVAKTGPFVGLVLPAGLSDLTLVQLTKDKDQV
jgi:hypothetical protein